MKPKVNYKGILRWRKRVQEHGPFMNMSSSWFKMLLILLLVAWLPVVSDAAESFSLLVPPDPISVRTGSSVTLPCWLSPALDAEAMEVIWHRSSFQNYILHYKDGQLRTSSQDPQFSGRSRLVSKGPEPGGLKRGDVSLRLENVTVEDEGEFECYVSNGQLYEKQGVVLSVTVTGTPPVLSVRQAEDGLLNASCASFGWHPQPQLNWSDSQGRSGLPPSGLWYRPEGQGLVSVFSWILAPPSDLGWLSCSVYLSEGEKMEGRMALLSPPSPPATSSPYTGDPSGPWRAAFIALLILGLLTIFIIIALLFKRNRRRGSKQVVEEPAEENHPLLQAGSEKGSLPKVIDFDEARKVTVDVVIDEDTAHQFLKFSKCGKRVRDSEVSLGRDPSKNRFTHLYFVLGKEGFTSGCAYWEVNLFDEKVGLKKSWSVGVVSESAERDCEELIPGKGYWVLSSDSNGLHVSTDTKILLGEKRSLRSVGVFLDYDKNIISFYNVEEKALILTLFTTFGEKVYPLFGPGKGDKAPLVLQTIPDVSLNLCNEKSQPLTLQTSQPVTDLEPDTSTPT